MNMLNTIRTTGRAALVAVALGATAFTTMPAQAAPQSSFSLSLNGGGMQFNNGGNITLQFGNGDFFNYCLTNNQIEKQLRAKGFKSVEVVKKLNNRKVLAIGRYNGVWYEMRVDRCTGKVDKVKKLYKKNSNANFSFTITF
ncbi:MAG: hypothetical protein ABIO40_02190 [Devosia sp.]